MKHYYVNPNPDNHGANEVHEDGCSWLRLVKNPIYLGLFNSCHDAVRKAKQTYPKVDGSYHCSPSCHTT